MVVGKKPTKKTLPKQISELRIVAQLLVPSLQKTNVVEVVSHLLAMQGQQVSAFPHAVLARSANTRFADVAAAFNQLQLVRHRPMRGTVHITCANDYHWIRKTLNFGPGAYVTRLEKHFNITDNIFAEATGIFLELAAKATPSIQGVKRKTLFDAWGKNFTALYGDPTNQRRFCNTLMWGLDRHGLVVEAPIGKNEHYFIDATQIPAADSKQSGFKTTETASMAAKTEIARRYITGHGPASVADLARWASITKKQASQALENNVESGNLARCQITQTGLAPLHQPAASQETYYIEPSLPDLAAQHRSELTQILFLPSFDEIHVGFENRTCLTDQAGEMLICPSQNGMFRPLIVQNSTLVAVLPNQGIQWIKTPSQSTQKRVAAVVNALKERLAN